MREVIATGKTVEEATENGCRELGLSREQVSVEILEMPVRKLFKSLPAKVKITADTDDDVQVEAPPAPKAQATAPPPPAPKPEAKPAPPKAQPAPAEAGQLLPAEPEEEIDPAQNPRAQEAVDYLMSIFRALDAGDTQIRVFRQGDATLLRVEGEQIAKKIDIKGEVIQALSYLLDRTLNAGVDKKDEDYLRIRLDVSGYRNRRESELVALAKRTGNEVLRTNRSRTLAPMNPYERLIVHTAISKMEGLISESIGADVERRVVIKSTAPDATDGEDWRPPRKGGGGGRGGSGNRGRSGGGGNRGGGNSRGRSGGGGGGRGRSGPGGGAGRGQGGYGGSSTPEREYADKPRDPNAAPTVPERREAVRDGEDLPLYGKIEL